MYPLFYRLRTTCTLLIFSREQGDIAVIIGKPPETKTPATFWQQALDVVETGGPEPLYFALDVVAWWRNPI